MKRKGVNYDVGRVMMGENWRPTFDAKIVHRELEIIKNDLHCNAIRICGLAIDRLMTATEDALKQGLEVWLSPEMWDKSQEETLDYIVRAAAAVEELREHFGVGKVYLNRRHDNHREHLYRYVVCRREDLLERIIPFFRDHPLRTAKQLDFEKFASCVERMAGGQHKTREGLAQIVEIMQTMNRRKPRHELIRILRDHTPDALDTG